MTTIRNLITIPRGAGRELLLHVVILATITALIAFVIAQAFAPTANAASAQNAQNARSMRNTGNLAAEQANATPRPTSAAEDATNNTVTIVQTVWYENGANEYFDPGVDVRASHAVVHCWIGPLYRDFRMDENGQSTNTITNLSDGADLHCWINIPSGTGFRWVQSVTVNNLMDGEQIELHYPLNRFYQMYMAAVQSGPAATMGAER